MTQIRLRTLGKLTLASAILAAAVTPAQVTLVNMVPPTRSPETNQDSEPSIAVNPSNPLQIAGSAFTWDDLRGLTMLGDLAPIYASVDGGLTWTVVMNVPSTAGAQFPTGDITLDFSGSIVGTTNVLYTGILHAPDFSMRVFRTPDYRVAAAMTLLGTRTRNVDQPHTQAATVPGGGQDRAYVGFNNGFGGVAPRTATVDFSLNAGIPVPVFNLALIESRGTGTGGQDGFANVPAIHPDGTVYVVFYGWRVRGASTVTSDVVVVRDDNWASGGSPFTALTDTGDGLPGNRVVMGTALPFTFMGQQRTGASNLAITVGPRNSSRVYIAWADQPPNTSNQTLHVRRSTDRGVTWSNDLLAVGNAVNPALAITNSGKVGFLYQQLTGTPSSPRWETHFTRTTDPAGINWDNPGLLLANTSATDPPRVFSPYLGDYDHVVADSNDFYGIFSASNFPDKANFFPGVIYQRFVDWNTHTLFADPALQRKVAVSIDPFFFKVEEKEQLPSFQYAAKFVCGKPDSDVVAPGIYFTAVNVHNPATKAVVFRKKFAIALPNEKAGPVSKFYDAKLGPDEAFEIDCKDIFRKTQGQASFLKGFAVLESDSELDVVTVYTAAGATGQVETMELERVAPRRQRTEGKPDLIPVPDAKGNFCRGKNGKLTVTVKNQGSADAPASTTKVDFGAAGTASQPTPPIPAGSSVDLLFDFPPSCFRPDCRFRITVDSGSVVDESNELNNTADGFCLG